MNARVACLGAGLALALSLSACGEREPGPEAKTRAEAESLAAGLSRLGLAKATFEGSERAGDRLVLTGVRGELAGNGTVTLARVEADGVPGRAGGLPAATILASELTGTGGRRLAGRVEAKDVPPVGQDPVAMPGWDATAVEAVVRGAPVKAEALAVTPRANSVQVVARQASLGASAFPPLPQDMVEDVARLPSDLNLTLTWLEDNCIDIRVEQWSSPLGRVSGSLVVGSADAGDPKPLAALAELPLPDLLNPARWPDGIVVRGGFLSGNLTHPGLAKAIDAGGALADPALQALVAPLRERLRLGGDDLKVRIAPTRSVPVNGLATLLSGDAKAVEGLGLAVEGLPGGPQAGAGR